MARLLLKFNTAVIKDIQVDKESITFGRKPGNDIIIDHPAVSGFHGKITKENNEFFVEDLNSTNGTFVNGRRIKKSQIENKDIIRAAKHILEFYTDILESPVPQLEDPSIPIPQESRPSNNGATPPPPSADEQREILRKSLGLSAKPAAPKKNVQSAEMQFVPAVKEEGHGTSAVIKIISGQVDNQVEIKITEIVTYIGTATQAIVKIKGFLAPSLAAAISKKPDGYFLKAVKKGYPKVNNVTVEDQIKLESGSLIECGGTSMVFFLPKSERPPVAKFSSPA